ncbi:MAG: hypothetical protein ACK521_10440 [bacterium]
MSPKKEKRSHREKQTKISFIETERQNISRIEKLNLFEKVAASNLLTQ